MHAASAQFLSEQSPGQSLRNLLKQIFFNGKNTTEKNPCKIKLPYYNLFMGFFTKTFRLLIFMFMLTSVCGCFCKKNTIELYLSSSDKAESFKKLAEKFTAENKGKLEVNIIFTNDEPRTFLHSRNERKQLPDIIAIDGNSTFTKLVEKECLHCFSGSRILENIDSNYLKQLLRISGSKADAVYGVPYAANVSGIICNAEVFEKYSVPFPNTWTELIDACKVFKANGIAPFEMTFGENDDWTIKPAWNNLASILTDDDFISRRYKRETTFFKECNEVLEKYSMILDYTQNEDIFSTSYNEGCRALARGNAAMLINGNWTVPQIRKFNPEIKLNTIPFPASDDIEKNCVNSGLDVILAVSKRSKNKKTALKFIEFLLRPENSQFYINKQYSFSAVKGIEQRNADSKLVMNLIKEGKIADYPDHYYPDNFDLITLLMDFAHNKQKKIPNKQNISVTLLNFDRSFDSIITTRTTVIEKTASIARKPFYWKDSKIAID